MRGFGGKGCEVVLPDAVVLFFVRGKRELPE
jgi:hypothetical protein